MAPRRSRPNPRSNPHDWAARLEPECTGYERVLHRATGRRTLVRCDADHDELVIDVPALAPGQIEVIADELATLWPGFLAPAGVSLRVGDEVVWDHEAMALRSHALRHPDA